MKKEAPMKKQLCLDRPRLDRPWPAAPAAATPKRQSLDAAAAAPEVKKSSLPSRRKYHRIVTLAEQTSNRLTSKRSRCPNCAEYQDRLGYILAENNHVREENRILRRRLSDFYGHRLDYEIPLDEYERSEPKENRTHDEEQFAPSGPAATA